MLRSGPVDQPFRIRPRTSARTRASARASARMQAANPARWIRVEFSIGNRTAARFARVVRAIAQPLQGSIDVIEHLRRLRQFGFVALFHQRRVTRHVSRLRILGP